MSKLTFEYIKANCVSGETILISVNNTHRYFIGWTREGHIITEGTTSGTVVTWYAHEIKDWTIKQPEREIIELYLTEDTNGVLSTCDKDGRYPDYEHKEMNDTDVTMYRINRSKEVYRRIYADTFERVKRVEE